ncbi:MAG: class I SAM-dependent methyltransferase [Blautia sp.]|nr:class I SAM-dependent methyltransferase [Blautia sp.]
MDLNETTEEVLYRHPWELSRTQCIIQVLSRYIDQLGERSKCASYINVGAGDLYFDQALLEKYPQNQVYAVDTAYKDMDSEDARIHKHHYLEEVDVDAVDYAVMMDSLEYMEDDAAYVRSVARKIRKGGFFFLTLPAYPFLFSDHDKNVNNLRRYSRKSFAELLQKVPELEKIEDHRFYTSLFMVRLTQKLLHLPIDPEHKVTAYWQYPRNHFFTFVPAACLTLDFKCNRTLSKAGIRIPGLSMLVVCRRV